MTWEPVLCAYRNEPYRRIPDPDGSRCSVEQSETHLALQLADQHTQAGWRDQKRFGCTGEAPMTRDEVESP